MICCGFWTNTFHNGGNEDDEHAATAEDTEYALTIRKRVIQFVHKWVIAVRAAVFEEPLTTAFIEVCCNFPLGTYGVAVVAVRKLEPHLKDLHVNFSIFEHLTRHSSRV